MQTYDQTPVLGVDDDLALRKTLRQALESWGCRVSEAENGRVALRELERSPRQLVLSDIDMPECDGFELLENIMSRHPQCGVIMVSGMSHGDIIDAALERGAIGYVQKPFRHAELKAQVTYALRKMQMTDELRVSSGAREFARLFAMTSDLHHIETGAHIRRIGKFSRRLSELAGCPPDFCEAIAEAAVLHDIGKLAIPDAILKKPGPLTPDEFEIMKTHPVLGGQILASATDPLLRMARTVALHHHERWDGKGYPHGFVGEACPLEARIVGVVDVYDALTEKRVYKEPWPVAKVQDFFAEKSKNMFDPELVNLLLTHYGQFESLRLADQTDVHL